MSVSAIIARGANETVVCQLSDSVRQAAKLLADKRIGALPVLDGDSIVGIFSERDLLYCIASEGESVLDRAVQTVMTSPPVTIAASADALNALSLMTRRRIRHLPVMDGERMVGFVSIGDLVKYRMERIEAEAAQMRDYITSA